MACCDEIEWEVAERVSTRNGESRAIGTFCAECHGR